MKPADAIRQFLAVLRAWRWVRFPTLTRPMLGLPGLPVAIAGHGDSLDDAFLARVQACYARAVAEAPGGEATVWAPYAARNAGFIDALATGEPSALRPFLQSLHAGPLMMGFAHVQGFVTGAKTIYPRRYFALRVRDALLALGEALGESGVLSNQQTPLRRYMAALAADPAPLLARIEARLGHPLAMPEVGCPAVAMVGGQGLNPDGIRHAWVPERLAQLGLLGAAPVLEIGGGYGVVARYAVLRGASDWTIVDLPYVNAIQMLWLGATLGPDRVSGWGEEAAAIRLVPNTAAARLAGRRFALALNMDSLPEIPEAEAAAYLDLVAAGADRFLSINQEAGKPAGGGPPQNNIHRMMLGRPMRLVQRSPYWMEQGYVEEHYLSGAA